MSRPDAKPAKMPAELMSVLEAGEKVAMFGSCTARVDRLGVTVSRSGTAFVSNLRFGMLTKKVGGQDLVEIPLSLISTVEFDRNITAAQVTVVGSGLTLKMERMQVNGAKEFVRVVREQIARSKSQVEVVSDTSGPRGSLAEEFAKLSELHEQGVLTSEEFAIAKSKLLEER